MYEAWLKYTIKNASTWMVLNIGIGIRVGIGRGVTMLGVLSDTYQESDEMVVKF